MVSRLWTNNIEKSKFSLQQLCLSNLYCRCFISITEEWATTYIHTSQLTRFELKQIFLSVSSFHFERIGVCVLKWIKLTMQEVCSPSFPRQCKSHKHTNRCEKRNTWLNTKGSVFLQMKERWDKVSFKSRPRKPL